MALSFPQDDDQRWSPLSQILAFFLSRLIEAIEAESDLSILMIVMQALKMCIENACRCDWARPDEHSRRPHLVPSSSRPLIEAPAMAAVSTALLRALAESVQRRAVARAEAQTDEDYDEEQAERDKGKGGEEEELQFNISEVLGAILKTHGALFLPQLAADWLPRLCDFSHDECLLCDRKLAAYVFCDLLEYCGDACAPALEAVIPILVRGVDSDEPTLRQPCAYALGVAASFAPAALAASSMVEPVLRQLCAAATKPGSRSGEQESATDNVVSALGALCVSMHSHPAVAPNFSALWDLYLGYLPLQCDLEESAKVVIQLCRLIKDRNTLFLGDQGQRLVRIWTIIVGSVCTVGPSGGAHHEIVETVRFLQGTLSSEQMEQLWARTGPDATAKLQELMAVT